MIESKLGGDEKWFPASKSLGGGQENLFFHADVAEKAGSKLRIRSLINMAGISHRQLKQRIKSPVVCRKKLRDRSHVLVLSSCHSSFVFCDSGVPTPFFTSIHLNTSRSQLAGCV